ncbi:MAG: hypothetical protein JW820_18575 [Spirochaetales bacterium]|nr:hypothetical protein [Spirochaetales bacterium]
MKNLSEFERAALEKLLAGAHPTLAELRVQAREARITMRERTRFGFHVEFDVPPDVSPLPTGISDFKVDDVWAFVDNLRWGAGLVLSVTGGCLDTLEGYSIGEPWSRRIGRFEIRYEWEPRLLDLPEALPETAG